MSKDINLSMTTNSSWRPNPQPFEYIRVFPYRRVSFPFTEWDSTSVQMNLFFKLDPFSSEVLFHFSCSFPKPGVNSLFVCLGSKARRRSTTTWPRATKGPLPSARYSFVVIFVRIDVAKVGRARASSPIRSRRLNIRPTRPSRATGCGAQTRLGRCASFWAECARARACLCPRKGEKSRLKFQLF